MKQRSRDLLETTTGLAPGDFKVVRDRFRFNPRSRVNHRMLVHALRQEAGLKRHHKVEKGIGF